MAGAPQSQASRGAVLGGCELVWTVDTHLPFLVTDLAVVGARVRAVGWSGSSAARGFVADRVAGHWLQEPQGQTRLETLSTDGLWIGGQKNGRALVMHQLGGHWVTVPTAGLGAMIVRAIDASGNDVWATGDFPAVSVFRLAGGRWEPLAIPAPLHFGAVIATLGNGRVWLAGDGVAMWTGTRWTRTFKATQVFALAATSPNNAWALDMGKTRVYALHWNGRIWTRSDFGPVVLRGNNFPVDVVPDGPGGVWAAGWKQLGRLEGGVWRTAAPPPGAAGDMIHAVAATPSDLWVARGSTKQSSAILHATCAS